MQENNNSRQHCAQTFPAIPQIGTYCTAPTASGCISPSPSINSCSFSSFEFSVYFPMLLSSLILPALVSAAATQAPFTGNEKLNTPQVNAITFSNLGYTGYYYDVEKLDDLDSCKCKLLKSFTVFEGTNTPLDEELSVHFRGPLKLHQFAFYSGDSYVKGKSLGTFTREAYYSALDKTGDNVTFLTNAGKDSKCLGKALTYASSNGTEEADSATLLADDTLLLSDQEYLIFSTSKCEKLGTGKDCGVYRSGIPAYHGFGGTVKMFLFEFEMPTEPHKNNSNIFYDMPAIWLLNAKIPRTSQYATNSNCSCWSSGCGEYDIFEVMNSTESNHLFSTIHDYQGSDNINLGMAAEGHFYRDLKNKMLGGVVFDNDGNAVSFLLNSTSIDSEIDASTLNKWIDTDSEVDDKMESVTLNTSQKKSEGIVPSTNFMAWLVSAFLVLMYI